MERAMLDSSFDSMFAINERGIIQTVNRAALQEFGYASESDLLGQNISVVVGGQHAPHHDRYLHNYSRTRIKRLIGTQRELMARRRDGSEFPCILGLQVIEGNEQHGLCYFASLRDISEEQEIRKLMGRIERDKLVKETILEVAFHSFLTTTTKGIITFANKAAVTTFGYDSADEMVGQNIKIIVGGGHAVHHDGYMERFMETKETHIIGSQREVPARRKDGSEFPAVLGIQFVEHQGGHEPFFVAFVRDVTLQKRQIELEAEKRAAEELLLNMLPQEIADRLKDNPHHLADHHANATVLFADIVGFTSLASKLTPLEVVELLNDLFSRFDDLVDKYKVNKVKTIGDCYMGKSCEEYPL
jgi:PAS domain S-box-containing protein